MGGSREAGAPPEPAAEAAEETAAAPEATPEPAEKPIEPPRVEDPTIDADAAREEVQESDRG